MNNAKTLRRKRRVKGSGALFYSPARRVWIGRIRVGGQVLERSAKTVDELQAKIQAAVPRRPVHGETVGEWCQTWLTRQQVRPRTLAIRTNVVARYLTPVIGHLPVSTLSPAHVEAACVSWGAGLSPNTVRLCASVLRTAMSAALRAGLCSTNPVKLAHLPRGERTRVEPYTAAQLARVVRASAKVPAARCIALLASTGCRIGEALALDCEDFDGRSVNITRTQHQDGTSGPPKSSYGTRVVPVPDKALPALRAAKGRRTSGPLFTDQYGHRTTHRRVAYAWERLCRTLKLVRYSLHKLRHSCASHLIASGFGLADTAKMLGDATETVSRTYLHAVGKDARKALNQLLRG